MSLPRHSHEQLVNLAKLSAEDLAEVNRRRWSRNRLGFAYQLDERGHLNRNLRF
jgi:hypothetical protein